LLLLLLLSLLLSTLEGVLATIFSLLPYCLMGLLFLNLRSCGRDDGAATLSTIFEGFWVMLCWLVRGMMG
jgi:hypothetical protein